MRNGKEATWRAVVTVFFALATVCGLTQAQPVSSKLLEDGEKAFAEHCAGCHGADATGSDRGPRLAASRRLRSRSSEQLRAGLPSAGMPAFHLPAQQLDSLVAFVRSLNSAAVESPVSGTPQAGEQCFFSKGQCASCHMVRGRGSAIGPDLSDVGREMTLSEIKEALLNPSARITPGYDLVNVRL
jgi:mono/diheme cytochrome c family protein